jgi:hypothetical protein
LRRGVGGGQVDAAEDGEHRLLVHRAVRHEVSADGQESVEEPRAGVLIQAHTRGPGQHGDDSITVVLEQGSHLIVAEVNSEPGA